MNLFEELGNAKSIRATTCSEDDEYEFCPTGEYRDPVDKEYFIDKSGHSVIGPARCSHWGNRIILKKLPKFKATNCAVDRAQEAIRSALNQLRDDLR